MGLIFHKKRAGLFPAVVNSNALDYSQSGNLVKLLQPGAAATLVGQARMRHKR
jgi:hypothetical protein